MRKTTGTKIAILIWVIWLATIEGKKMAPYFLGSSGVQWSSAVLVAILIPLGTLIALGRLANPHTRRAGLGLLIACVTPLLINLASTGVAGPIMARTNAMLISTHVRDAEMIAKFTRQAVDSDVFKKRKAAAWGLYRIFGVRCVWRDESGTLSIYIPSSVEEESWEKTAKINAQMESTTKMLDDLLKQFPWMFALNLGAFSLILFSGLVWHIYRTKSVQDIAPNDQ